MTHRRVEILHGLLDAAAVLDDQAAEPRSYPLARRRTGASSADCEVFKVSTAFAGLHRASVRRQKYT